MYVWEMIRIIHISTNIRYYLCILFYASNDRPNFEMPLEYNLHEDLGGHVHIIYSLHLETLLNSLFKFKCSEM